MFISVYGIFWYLFYPIWSKPCNSTFFILAENQTAEVPMIFWVSAHPWNLAKWSSHVLFQRNQTMNLKLEEVNVKKIVQNWLVVSFFSPYWTPWTCFCYLLFWVCDLFCMRVFLYHLREQNILSYMQVHVVFTCVVTDPLVFKMLFNAYKICSKFPSCTCSVANGETWRCPASLKSVRHVCISLLAAPCNLFVFQLLSHMIPTVHTQKTRARSGSYVRLSIDLNAHTLAFSIYLNCCTAFACFGPECMAR